jgi:hypothetical protein
MEALAQLRYAFESCLGRVLSDVELNTVYTMHVDRQTYFGKRRRWFVAPLVAAGNVYLKLLGAHARVLSDHEWRCWEAAVYRLVYDVELTTDERGRLLIPAWSGISLAAYLESKVNSQAEKLFAIRLVVEALSRLHGVVMAWPDGQKRPLSHGDATVENVIIDSARMHASWFDFDTSHESRMDAAWRHADDLRALTYSAAERLPAASYPEMTETIVENYCFAAALEALAEAVTYRRTRPISFHLAQARIGYRERRLLDETLLNSLSRRDKT